MKVWFRLVAFTMLGFSVSPGVLAQAYPTKPIRLVVPVAPGGNLDIVSRAMAERLSEAVGRPLLVENKAGANSIIGTEFVARSAPDGYTFLMVASTYIIVPSLSAKPAYDPVRDLTGVSLIAWIPQILIVNPSVPARSVRDLIAYAKVNPGKLNYGTSGGSGSHVASELFKRLAGVDIAPILYKGLAPALVDVLGGHVSMMIDTISTSTTHVREGKVRALGVTSPGRSALFPDVPSISETIPGYESRIFNAMMAPVGTPKPIVDRMHREIARVVQSADLQNRFAQQGVEMTASASPEQFSDFIKTDYERWSKVIREAGIKAE